MGWIVKQRKCIQCGASYVGEKTVCSRECGAKRTPPKKKIPPRTQILAARAFPEDVQMEARRRCVEWVRWLRKRGYPVNDNECVAYIREACEEIIRERKNPPPEPDAEPERTGWERWASSTTWAGFGDADVMHKQRAAKKKRDGRGR